MALCLEMVVIDPRTLCGQLHRKKIMMIPLELVLSMHMTPYIQHPPYQDQVLGYQVTFLLLARSLFTECAMIFY